MFAASTIKKLKEFYASGMGPLEAYNKCNELGLKISYVVCYKHCTDHAVGKKKYTFVPEADIEEIKTLALSGMDIDQVRLIMNRHLPITVERYFYKFVEKKKKKLVEEKRTDKLEQMLVGGKENAVQFVSVKVGEPLELVANNKVISGIVVQKTDKLLCIDTGRMECFTINDFIDKTVKIRRVI